jgi:transposase-like protein
MGLRSTLRWHLARAGQTPQDGIHEDRRQRKRHRTRGQRLVVRVALGLWTDGSGQRHILDASLADQQHQPAWERLVLRLWERGVKGESGLQALVRAGTAGVDQALDYVYGCARVHQRCRFHPVRHGSQKGVGLARAGNKLRRAQAAAGSQASRASEARARLRAVGQCWRATQPQAVATCEHEGEQTIRA